MKKSLGPHTVLYPHPALVVGTYDIRGVPNLATVAWAGICCSKPPCVAVSLRAATKTHGNLAHRGAFTVCVPHEGMLDAVDYVGSVSGRDENMFEATGLTLVRSDRVDAPYADEFPFVLECRLRHTHELGLHTQFVGEIVDVKAEEDVLNENGYPDLAKVRPIVFSAGDSAYFRVGERIGDAYVHRK